MFITTVLFAAGAPAERFGCGAAQNLSVLDKVTLTVLNVTNQEYPDFTSVLIYHFGGCGFLSDLRCSRQPISEDR